jgi:hypothetical protein
MANETLKGATDRIGLITALKRLDDRLIPMRRYAGLLTAGGLLLVYLLGILVYSTAGLVALNGDLTNPQKVLPAVSARPIGFVVLGIGYVILGATVWFLFRTLRAIGRRTLDRYLRPAAVFGTLACAIFVLYGLFIAIRLPWLASDYTQHPLPTADVFPGYLNVSNTLLSAANVALGGALIFACLGLIREKTFSRYLTLLGMFWGITAVAGAFPEIEAPIVEVIGELCGFIWILGMGFAFLRLLPGDSTGATLAGSDAEETMKMPRLNVREPEA